MKIRNVSRSIKNGASWALWGSVIFALIVSATPLANPVRADGHDHADFDHVFDFEEALRRDFVLALDDVA